MEETTIELLKRIGKFDTVHECTFFTCYRTSKDDHTQKVEVTIFDEGAGNPQRYSVSAESDDGRACSGNPGDTIHEALAKVHWCELDKPGPAEKKK